MNQDADADELESKGFKVQGLRPGEVVKVGNFEVGMPIDAPKASTRIVIRAPAHVAISKPYMPKVKAKDI